MVDKNQFWKQQATAIDWIQSPERISNSSFHSPVQIKWFEDGQLNTCYNCVDRHAVSHPEKIALIWEGDDPQESQCITFAELQRHVMKMANILKHLGVGKGDRVAIYMPMIPEAAYAMLACARIGAIHSVVFGGFSPASLAGRIQDCGAVLLITADESVRGGKRIALKSNADEALQQCDTVRHCLVVRRTGAEIHWHEGRDQDYQQLYGIVPDTCGYEPMAAEDPLFILYTSGSTGKPKGILHTTGGYLVYAAYTFRHIFDAKPDDIHWCSADVGWITGHSYVLYGPLANGITTLMFEGVPSYPEFDRFWQVIDKHRVTLFYTAPTAIRALMKEGDEYLTTTHRNSLRVLGSVGEPINPEAWHWYHDNVGKGRCAVVDTWWQTETGGILIAPTAKDKSRKAGSATKPLPMIQPRLLDGKGQEIQGEGEGNLCLRESWPGQARSIYGDHARFEQTYFSTFKGYYMTGDGARRDKEGDYWITGRVDDVLNVSGHRLGTAEIEAALNEHPLVVESAVVGYPHEVKGQGIYAYLILTKDSVADTNFQKELNGYVRRIIGPVASVDRFHIVQDLPKTRSGKIMRRILRKIAEGSDDFGDTSTLSDPNVVEMILDTKPF